MAEARHREIEFGDVSQAGIEDRCRAVHPPPLHLARPGSDRGVAHEENPTLNGKRDTFVTVDDEGVDSSGETWWTPGRIVSMAERYRFPRGVLAWVG